MNTTFLPHPLSHPRKQHALEIENKVLEQLKQALQVKDVIFLHIVKNWKISLNSFLNE